MRLKSVFISQYKNLRNFSLDFDGASFIDVFVGKNGSGKSNLFEALIEIFRHLVEFGGSENPIGFDYRIRYEIGGNETSIAWENENLTINGRTRKTLGSTPLPDNILVYYSGHNDTVKQLIDRYETVFRRRIKGADLTESRRFYGIGQDYKSLLLAMLLMQPEGNTAREYVRQKLGIERLGLPIPGTNALTEPVVRLTLLRPTYALGKSEFNIEANDESDRYWKTAGITKDFLNILTLCVESTPGNLTVNQGYFPADGTDYYVLYLSLRKLQAQFQNLRPQNVFRMFDNLKTLGMLAEISIPLRLVDGSDGDIGFFSDGQFQSVYIYAIAELFKDRNCLTLLDEPDAFLHPEWQFEFLKQVFEISEAATAKNHVLLSSHSAVTLIPHERTKIKFFDISANLVNCYELPKRVAIQKLSANLIKYSEQEQLLSIINAIQIEKKPVLFTEGSTDPLIIKEAWARLCAEDMPFIPFYAFSCTYIKQLLTDNRIHQEMGGLPVFALFDFDEAYNQWNGLNGTVLQDDPFQGKIKKWQEGESYAFMLPIPNNARIRAQSVHPATGQTFGGSSCCAIEHLFYGAAGAAAYFVDEPCAGGSRIVFKSDGDKTAFAKEVVPTLPDVCFQPLKPMFEFIAGKCVELTPVAAAPRRRRGR